jgi:hypothetical protein
LFIAACTGSSSSSPATAPETSSTQPPVTSAATITATPTTLAPPTTVDRLAEIEAIFADLEFRRLDALYREDEEAFRAVFANEAYLEESLDVLGVFVVPGEPAPSLVDVVVIQVLVDREDCLAAEIDVVAPEVLDSDTSEPVPIVLSRLPDDTWGFAFVGTGWLCDGPHPLENA